MRQSFVWPVIIAVGALGYQIYELVIPCNGGMVIGGCELGKWMVFVMLLESLLLYTLIANLYGRWKNKHDKQITRLELILLGMVSLFVVFAGLFAGDSVFGWISFPFMAIALLSVGILMSTPLGQLFSMYSQFWISLGKTLQTFLHPI